MNKFVSFALSAFLLASTTVHAEAIKKAVPAALTLAQREQLLEWGTISKISTACFAKAGKIKGDYLILNLPRFRACVRKSAGAIKP